VPPSGPSTLPSVVPPTAIARSASGGMAASGSSVNSTDSGVSGEDDEAVIDAAYELAKGTLRPATSPNDRVRYAWEPYGFDPNNAVSGNVMPPRTDKAIFRLFYIGQLKPSKGRLPTEVVNNLVSVLREELEGLGRIGSLSDKDLVVRISNACSKARGKK